MLVIVLFFNIASCAAYRIYSTHRSLQITWVQYTVTSLAVGCVLEANWIYQIR